ncbi:MAG: FAD-dependent oxidoreductase [Candidatus Magasanikbacteria bacterium]
MENKQEELLDLVIIGAAAAGSAAAIYASRRNLNFKIVAKDIGGEVALSGDVGNWPGIIETTGYQLAQDFRKHVESYGNKIEEGFEVTAIKQEKKYHTVTAKNFLGEEKVYNTKSVIIASGIHPRNLNLPGEIELRGRGVTYCTVCDGPLFKDKTTATIGAGNAAIESALMMAGISKKVYLITKFPDNKETLGGFPKAETILVNKIKKLANVEIIYNAETTEILGKDRLEGLKYTDKETKEEKQIEIDGLMVHIGMIPNSSFVTCGTKNPVGEIEVDIKCQTSCKGVFAAGDVTNIPYKQIVISAGQGVTAALSAIEYINKWEE